MLGLRFPESMSLAPLKPRLSFLSLSSALALNSRADGRT